jgi:putative DNA primase/helicase
MAAPGNAISVTREEAAPKELEGTRTEVLAPLRKGEKAVSFPNAPVSQHARPPCTIDNVDYVLRSEGIRVRYNVISKKIETKVPGMIGAADNIDSASMTTIISLAAGYGMATGHVPEMVAAIANRNEYNPVKKWIEERPWDRQDRLPDIAMTIEEEDEFPSELKFTLVRKWLRSAAAAILIHGFKSRGVLTLQGRQGIGKTSWGMALINNRKLREAVLKVDHHLDGSNKDSILGAISHWIVEIGELDSSFRKDVARLKGFLTSDKDKVRVPYARTASEYPRRTVFFATVNEVNFLVDTTGNSRFWTIPVVSLNYEHDIDMQQVFAQMASEVLGGEIWWLTPEEDAQLAACNSKHQAVSALRDRILDRFDLSLIEQGGNPHQTATQLLIDLGMVNPTNPQAKECGSILRDILGEPRKVQGRVGWRMPIIRDTMKYDRHVPKSPQPTDEEDDRY